MNLYVIDDVTRQPISGATVRVGTMDGTTDATGLFVAEGLTGAQTVVVKAASYRSEMWVGANGANMTMDLQAQVATPPGQANLSGAVTNIGSISVAAGHIKLVSVAYSQSDNVGDAENNIATTGNQNLCFVVQPTDPCNFTVASRTGRVGLIAAIFDRDLHGTPNDPNDDTMQLVRWAIRTNIQVVAGVAQTAQDLTIMDAADLNPVSIDFGSPPAGLPTIGGYVGIDGGADGVYQLLIPMTPTASQLLVPKLAALASTNYRITAIAQNGTGDSVPQSIVLRRALTDTTLPVGSWLSPPSGVTATRTGASWSATSGATANGIEYVAGTGTSAMHLLNVTVFDGSTSFTVPDVLALPSATLDARVSAIGATGFDVNNFALDTDRTKLDHVGMQPITVN